MNINSLNYRLNDDSIKNVSINVNSNKDDNTAKTVGDMFSNAGVSGLGATTSTESAATTVKSLMQDADDVLEQLKTSAETAKGSLNALFKRLSGADCVELDEDGYNLNDTEPEEIVTVVDRIKIMLATYCDDYQLTGSDVSLDKIRQVVGSTSMAVHVEGKLSDANLPSDEENVSDVMDALTNVEDTAQLTQATKDYLVKNNIEPTIDNVHNAQYQSGSVNPNAKPVAQGEWQQLKSQVEKAISQAGLEVNDDSLNMARHMLENDIDLSDDNLKAMADLDSLDLGFYKTDEGKERLLDLIVDNLISGNSSGSTNLLGKQSDISIVANAIKTVNRADAANVSDVLSKGHTLTIAALQESLSYGVGGSGYVSFSGASYCDGNIPAAFGEISGDVDRAVGALASYIASDTASDEASWQSLKDVQALRSLTEIQILMTADAGLNLVRQGFDINVMPLAELAENLKKLELEWIGNEPYAGNATENDADGASTFALEQGVAANTSYAAELMYRSLRALRDITMAPDDVLGSLAPDNENLESVTIGQLADFGNSMREQYRRANRTYEAVGTQVRRDLGDSVAKALDESTSDILRQMGLDDTRANRDAVRIIANTQLELNEENVSRVKAAYGTLNSLIENMTPQAVLSMIRDDVNPMDTGIGELNEYLKSVKAQDDDNDTVDKFGRFLYKLDRTNGITAEERKQFIGIYRMVNIFRKDAGKAVGQLISSGRDVTMSNLVSAYESRRAAGIDRTVDDTTGMAEVTGQINYYDNLFAKNENRITPLTLKNVNDEKPIMERGVEEFEEAVDEAYDPQAEAAYYDEYLQNLKEVARDADAFVIRELERFEEPVTLNNIEAMQLMNAGGAYGWSGSAAGRFANAFLGAVSTDGAKYDAGMASANGANSGAGTSVSDDIAENVVADVAASTDETRDAATQLQDSLEAIYDTLAAESDAKLNEALESAGDYDDLRMARLSNSQIHLLADMGRRHDYNIPVEVGGEFKNMHLQLVEDEENAGRIAIDMDGGALGKLHIETKTDSEGTKVFALSDSDADGLKEKITEALEGVENLEVNVGKSDVMPGMVLPVREGKISTARLYTIASRLVRGLIA